MITAVSIILYFVAATLAASLGVSAEQFKHSRVTTAVGKFSMVGFVVAFLMAAALQVAA